MSGQLETIVIGGSAGALDVLCSVLVEFEAEFSVPIAVVLHVPPHTPSKLAEVLSMHCRLSVKEAEDKEPLLPGSVYIAPPNYHLLIARDRSVSLSADDPVLYCRPSIDVLFESAAEAFGAATAGVLLSGANEDGAHGLSRMRRGGALTIVQSPETSAVPTMPQAALRLDSGHQSMPVELIGPCLARLDRDFFQIREGT